jgi:hypothetical protein
MRPVWLTDEEFELLHLRNDAHPPDVDVRLQVAAPTGDPTGPPHNASAPPPAAPLGTTRTLLEPCHLAAGRDGVVGVDQPPAGRHHRRRRRTPLCRSQYWDVPSAYAAQGLTPSPNAAPTWRG